MNKYKGASIKREVTDIIYWEAKSQKLKPVSKPVHISITWYCKNKKKDPDNIAFAKKFILDGLVKAGVLENDGWKQIEGFTDKFEVDKKNPRVEVLILGEEE